MFRRQASKTKKLPDNQSSELFLTLNGDARSAIRSKLLECLATEQINHVRNKIGDAVAEIARQYTDNNESWIELLSALFQASQAPDHGMRECAFRILWLDP
jgi:importin-5